LLPKSIKQELASLAGDSEDGQRQVQKQIPFGNDKSREMLKGE
jgi:hypothetical protein